jgi:hypothetical protein
LSSTGTWAKPRSLGGPAPSTDGGRLFGGPRPRPLAPAADAPLRVDKVVVPWHPDHPERAPIAHSRPRGSGPYDVATASGHLYPRPYGGGTAVSSTLAPGLAQPPSGPVIRGFASLVRAPNLPAGQAFSASTCQARPGSPTPAQCSPGFAAATRNMSWLTVLLTSSPGTSSRVRGIRQRPACEHASLSVLEVQAGPSRATGPKIINPLPPRASSSGSLPHTQRGSLYGSLLPVSGYTQPR